MSFLAFLLIALGTLDQIEKETSGKVWDGINLMEISQIELGGECDLMLEKFSFLWKWNWCNDPVKLKKF